MDKKLDQETWLCRTLLNNFFSKKFDYFRPYKNQVEPGYKGHPIEFMVNFFVDPLGPFGTIEDHFRPLKTILNILGTFYTYLNFFDHLLPFMTMLDNLGPYLIIFDCVGSLWIVLDHLGTFGTILDHCHSHSP